MNEELREYDHAAPKLTTGEAGDLLGVSQQLLIRCFDKGHLRGFRIPLSRFRRVYLTSVVDFAAEHGIELTRGDVDRVMMKVQTRSQRKPKTGGTDASQQPTT